MDISYFGHSMFRIKGRNATLITDPYSPDMVGLKYAKLECDIVTVSHSHEDHSYLERVGGYKMVVNAPGEYEILGVSIIGILSFHDARKGDERGKNVIFVLEVDGLRVAHLGDLGHKLDEKILEEMGSIDILMLPVGGYYTVGPREAFEVVQSVEPKIVIPMHYKMQGMKEEIFGKLSSVEEFLKLTGIPVEKMEKYVVKKEDLDEEQKVVLLEKRS